MLSKGGERDDAHDLLVWLVLLGQTDRDQYREIRAAAWAMRVERSRCSDVPSKTS